MEVKAEPMEASRGGEAPPLPIHAPRDYQLTLFRQALRTNSIVMLETGTGKTLVAVMLIQWFAQRARGMPATAAQAGAVQARRKVRVFLNTTVALVHQQAKVIAANTDQAVNMCIGAMGIDEWDEKTWTDKWSSSGVLVMTHQVLLNSLRAGFVRISDIDLLVFDECHHARGNHPYTLIMREFYDMCPELDRPHIFGMTASPLNAHESAEESVAHLQAGLDSHVCTVDLTAATGATLSAATGVCYEYSLPPEFGDTPLTAALTESCGMAKMIAKGLRAAPVILSLLGPFAVDQMWFYYVRQWYRVAVTRPAPRRQMTGGVYAAALPEGGIEADDEPDVDADGGEDGELSVVAQPAAAAAVELDPQQDISCLKQALEIVRAHDGGHIDAGSTDPASAADGEAAVPARSWDHPVPQIRVLATRRRPWDELRSQLTPQVNRLLGILARWRDEPDKLRGIVFTSRRITAVLLTYVVSQIAEFEFIKADALLGAAQKAGGNVDRPIRGGSVRAASQLTLADFGSGRLNLLFATQVAEEGVDIQPCNLVIRFDMPMTATSLIQSRGRARMAGSQFIVLVPEISAEQRVAMEADATTSAKAPIIPCTDGDAAATAMDIDAGNAVAERKPLPEHMGTYTDYLKLVNLEECLRDWCRAASQGGPAAAAAAADGVIVASRRHKEYGRAMLSLRTRLVVDDDPNSNLEDVWIEQGDSAGRVYIIAAT
ncbi:Dicer-like protein 1, partial [Coemansia nantahalensis]